MMFGYQIFISQMDININTSIYSSTHCLYTISNMCIAFANILQRDYNSYLVIQNTLNRCFILGKVKKTWEILKIIIRKISKAKK